MKNLIDVEKYDISLNQDILIDGIKGKLKNLPPLKALKQLMRTSSSQTSQVCRSILKDKSYSIQMRRNTAHALGNNQSPKNQEALINNLQSSDKRLKHSISKALGKIGDLKAYEALDKLKVPSKGHLEQAATFSKLLIDYRLGLNKTRFPNPTNTMFLKVEKRKSINFKTQAATPAKLENIHQLTNEILPAIELSEKGAIEISCRDSKMYLVFNKKFITKRAFNTLFKNNAVPLVLLKKSYVPERFSLVNYFFTHPSDNKDELYLTGTRPDGVPVYFGVIKIVKGSASFEIKALKNRYVPPIDMKGTYRLESKEFSFSTTISQLNIDRKTFPPNVPRIASE